MRNWLMLGAINGGLAVAAGAFAAHGLKPRLAPEMLAVFETAARYHMYHALALLAVGLLIQWQRTAAAANGTLSSAPAAHRAPHAAPSLRGHPAAARPTDRLLTAAAACFLAGIVLFSGSLYALALTGIKSLGAITPFGGTLWLIAWLLLALTARRRQ